MGGKTMAVSKKHIINSLFVSPRPSCLIPPVLLYFLGTCMMHLSSRWAWRQVALHLPFLTILMVQVSHFHWNELIWWGVGGGRGGGTRAKENTGCVFTYRVLQTSCLMHVTLGGFNMNFDRSSVGKVLKSSPTIPGYHQLSVQQHQPKKLWKRWSSGRILRTRRIIAALCFAAVYKFFVPKSW